MDDQRAAGRRRVDHRLLERAEPDAALLKIGHDVDEVRDRAAEPVELPDDENVLAGTDERDRLFKIGPGEGGTTDAVVVENALAAGGSERIELGLRLLVGG
nr:hypothetical protein [Polymorphobacter sp. PAMC 29334]